MARKTKAVRFTESGKVVVDDVDELNKTGRHYDIESILKQMQGGIDMAKRELIDIEDAITECRNSFDISEAVVNMRDWCHIITEQEIVKPYLDKIRAKFISLYPKNYAGGLELGGAGCVFSLNKVLEILDKYKVESEE